MRHDEYGMRKVNSNRHGIGFAGISNSQAFTLVEIMVVIIVLGVMLSLIIPRLGELGEANLKRSARHLTGMIRDLRDESQARKAVFRLRFDVQGGHYWPEILTRTSSGAAEFRKFNSELAGEGSLSGQTTFSDVQAASHPDDPYILFTPDGWVEMTYIHLKDGDNRPFTLIVKPLTGDTELRKGYLEAREGD
jgi:prepilin-type N-terminal cleavage/methylation domain-containing protein